MKERPILFSGPMVRAILEGRKTQTRRVVKGAPAGAGSYVLGVHQGTWGIHEHADALEAFRARCPYGQPGDRLWVKETWSNDVNPWYKPCLYRSDFDGPCGREMTATFGDADLALPKWRPSIFMPRWASRVTLEIVRLRVERVQEICEEDAKAEGANPEFEISLSDFLDKSRPLETTHRIGYKHLWDSINAERGFGWGPNPWVWVVEFKRVEGGQP